MGEVEPAVGPALPGEPCRVPPHESWSDLEKWVWDEISSGRIADISEKLGETADPRKPEDWQDGRRRLAARFLEDLLLREPHRSGLHRKGVRIRGAWFDQEIDLEGAEVVRQILLDDCRFEQPVLLMGLQTPYGVSLGSAFASDLQLSLARIRGQVALVGAKVAGTLHMESVDIGQQLFMQSPSDAPAVEHPNADSRSPNFFRHAPLVRTEFNEVDLRGAKVGGQVALVGAKVAGTLNMESVDIGQSLLMGIDRSGCRTEFNEVDLSGAKVGGEVGLVGVKVAGTLNMESVDIGDSLFMRGDPSLSEQRAEFDHGVHLIFAEIGRTLDVQGAVLSSLDLTGTRIGGELTLASPLRSPGWKDGGRLVLRNASVDAIQDMADEGVWPSALELDGFTYRRFGGFGAGADADVATRGSRWFIDWLAKDEPYTPQPYQQCAKVLREMGHPEMANDLLYAGRERERKEAWRTGNNSRGTGLTLLKWFIGYGYGQGYFRSLWWVAGMVALGTLLLLVSGQIDEVGGSLLAAAFYSFDLLLPIIQLYEPHYKIVLDGFAKYYFAIHKLMGYVLASFLIAGLAGLTK